MDRVRLGVIGCGVIGNDHMRSAKELPDVVELAAVADIRPGALRTAVQTYKVPAAFADGEALIQSPDIDAVVLAMPAANRAGLAEKAFAAGKHVLVEKPIAACSADVERMIRARGDRVGACCSARKRCVEPAPTVQRFLESGALGPLRELRCRAIVPAGKRKDSPPVPWRLSRKLNGGGIFVNWGCYDLDYLLGLTGWSVTPQCVLARTWRVAPQFEDRVAPDSDAETHLAALITCRDGIAITYERGEYMAAHADESWEIIGTRSSLRLNMFPTVGAVIMHDDTTPADGVVTRTLWQAQEDTARLQGRSVLEDFARAILEKRAPATPLEKALILQRITDAVYASADSGRPQEIHQGS